MPRTAKGARHRVYGADIQGIPLPAGDWLYGALLHDSIEDVEPTDQVRATIAWFGPRVLAIVEGCTDADVYSKPPWREHVLVFHGRDTEGCGRISAGGWCACRRAFGRELAQYVRYA